MSAIAAKDDALAALRRGDLDAALFAAERAVALDFQYAEGWAARGTVKLFRQDAAGAAVDLRQACDLKPVFAEAHLNLAMAFTYLFKADDAEAAMMRAKAIDPALSVEVCLNRLLELRRGMFDHDKTLAAGLKFSALLGAAGKVDDAEMILERCRQIAPENADVWSLKGDLALRQGRFADAEAAARTAADLRPVDPGLATNIAGVQFEAGDRMAALATARAVTEKFPNACRAWIQLADILDDDSNEGWDALRHAALTPDATGAAVSRALWIAAERVEWDIVDELRRRLIPLLEKDSANPLRLCLHAMARDMLRRNAERFSRDLWIERRALVSKAIPKQKLRIAYLSPDFRTHPIGIIMLDLLRRHDRDKFEIYAYAVGPQSDSPERKAIAEAVDNFAVISDLSDFDAARRIREDGVDILIDLAGHTLHGRLGILSFRPAPLQLHYLGYPGTTGASFVDYIVGDPWTIPLGAERHFTEAVIRFPHTYLANSHRAPAAPGWDRARYGFADRDIVLCSFNHPTKITREMFDAWTRILAAVPEAVLWLWVDHPVAMENLMREANERGIKSDRLRFSPRADYPIHLARYGVADLALDTTPYNGHATAADALWMRCPILTLPGESFASCVCASLLDMIGMQDLIAADLDDYVAKAIASAGNRTALTALRARLANVRDGILFDMAAFTRTFEHGLTQAWERKLAGLEPATFDVGA